MDKRGHATHAFEDFFSPPHLFVCTMHRLATMTLAYRPIIGALMFVVGSLLAVRIWSVVAVPTRTGVFALTTLAGIVMPPLTGIADLTLRARIP